MILGTRFSVILGTRFSILGTQFSILGTQFSILGTQIRSLNNLKKNCFHWKQTTQYYVKRSIPKFAAVLDVHLRQWCSNFLARGSHSSFRNPSRATRINNLNENSLKNYLKWLKQWCSNFLARWPHLSFRNPSRATGINNLNTNYLKNYLKWLKC